MNRDERGWSVEVLVLATMALLIALANIPFWREALAGRSAADLGTWRFVAGTTVLLAAAQAVVVLLLATRATVRPLLGLLIVASLVAQHLMQRYGVVLDPSMMRNALRTEVREASELVSPWLLVNAGIGAVAFAALCRVPIRRRTALAPALGRRLAFVAGTAVVGVAALLLVFQDFSSTMRNQRELRYRITPANLLYSTGRALAADMRDARRAREPLLPVHAASPAHGRKPRLLVMVVGETARAMNFSLNGYARDTNPELAALPVVNFTDVTACGTSTEVSVPCLFSSFGRARYDEARIRASESLPQLLARAGLHVVWLDNQAGCKKVCAGLEFVDVSSGTDPRLCPGGECLDGVLLDGLRRVVEAQGEAPARDTVVVLHQLGNHGPAYSKRYPREFAHFQPECTKRELRECSREEIVNSYDNAIRYTDHLLAQAVGMLQGWQQRFDVGLMYFSDHGESLGEKGLYLHGMPYAIAPREQLAVPMLWWFGGAGARGWDGVDAACLRERARRPARHDDIYHSVLGLMQIETPSYDAGSDLVGPCRRGGADG
ncbi:phosphoethanolamine transferase [Piscinibacter sp.]|uniref:phosphoethanolamine transferase n=1 Tax=Piscinibacter sp. TaxID=1903157 RepID=UPI0039E60C81